MSLTPSISSNWLNIKYWTNCRGYCNSSLGNSFTLLKPICEKIIFKSERCCQWYRQTMNLFPYFLIFVIRTSNHSSFDDPKDL